MAGEKQPGALQETPEFKAAVSAAVNEAMEHALPVIMARLASLQGVEPPPGSQDDSKDEHGLGALAVQIAEVAAQNSGRQYTDPKILKKRREAGDKLKALLAQFRRDGIVPAYKLVGKTVLHLPGQGATLIDPLYRDVNKAERATEVDYPLEPNLAMRPIDEPAERVYQLFLEMIGHEEAGQDDELGDMALTPSGAVVRGAAAAAVLRHSNAQHGEQTLMVEGVPMPRAMIRRGNERLKRKVQVMGGLPPIEVS